MNEPGHVETDERFSLVAGGPFHALSIADPWSHSRIQLVVAAGIPMLAVFPTQIPLRNLLKWLVGTIL